MDSRSRAAVTSTDPRVQAALQDYFGGLDRGERIEVEKFVAQHAEVADELRSFIAFDEEARRLAGGVAPSTDSPNANAQVTVPPRSKAEVSTHSVVGKVVKTVRPTPGNQAPTGGATPESIPRRSVVAPPSKTPSPPKSPNDLPESFGRYQVKQKLGEGAMGAVYLAEDLLLQRKVALKTPTFEDDEDDELLRRFHREARAVANLKHPNLCAVYDVGEIDGRHYISMEFVAGKKLQEFIKPDKPMTEKQTMAVVRKIALGMQEAHTHGVIHRDLKPDNIMVNEKGEPVVMDFGLVHKTESKGSTRITQRGMLVGSPAYMSKEQVEGDSDTLTVATDQYSLGVILYQLLTSKLPFEGGIHAVLAAILTKVPPPPSEYRPDLNPHLEVVCLKMMAKEAKDRYPSMKVVADALAEVAKGTSRAAGSVTVPAPFVRSLTDGITATFTGIPVTSKQTLLSRRRIERLKQQPVTQFERFVQWLPREWRVVSLVVALLILTGSGAAVVMRVMDHKHATDLTTAQLDVAMERSRADRSSNAAREFWQKTEIQQKQIRDITIETERQKTMVNAREADIALLKAVADSRRRSNEPSTGEPSSTPGTANAGTSPIQENDAASGSSPAKPDAGGVIGVSTANRPNLQSVYPPSKLRILNTHRFDKNIPFRRLNESYENNGVFGIRAHSGVFAWNFVDMSANQMIRAKVRVRNNSSGWAGVCLTQKGDLHGAHIWITGDRRVVLAPSIFAKEKPKMLQRIYDLPDVVRPLEEWNDLAIVLRNDSLSVFINSVHVDTVDLTAHPISPTTLAFTIYSSANDTVVEMDEYTMFTIK